MTQSPSPVAPWEKKMTELQVGAARTCDSIDQCLADSEGELTTLQSRIEHQLQQASRSAQAVHVTRALLTDDFRQAV